MKTLKEIRNAIENENMKSAWSKGVKEYALEIIEDAINYEGENYEFYGNPADKKMLLNGADNWIQYSEGGCSLIYNEDIAKRLCTPSELKRSKNGFRNPNKNENWIECQARALIQAYRLIMNKSK